MDVVTVQDGAVDGELLGRLRALLDGAFHGRFADADWHHTTGGWRCIAFDGDDVVAHAAVVPRAITVDERSFAAGYVEGVAALPGRHGGGLGSAVMTAAAAVLHERFELGVLSTDRRSFYERLGWERWRGPSYVRDGGAVVRTADEDDGLLVLRFGPSADVDTAGPITCDCRAGDDW